MIATFLCGEVRSQLLMACLTHDVGETYTGDVPYPVKVQHPQLKAYLDACEEHYRIMNGLNFACSEEDYQILKAADMLDLVLKCIDEMQLGNQTVEQMFNTGMRVLKKMQLPGSAHQRLQDILKEIGDAEG